MLRYVSLVYVMLG